MLVLLLRADPTQATTVKPVSATWVPPRRDLAIADPQEAALVDRTIPRSERPLSQFGEAALGIDRVLRGRAGVRRTPVGPVLRPADVGIWWPWTHGEATRHEPAVSGTRQIAASFGVAGGAGAMNLSGRSAWWHRARQSACRRHLTIASIPSSW